MNLKFITIVSTLIISGVALCNTLRDPTSPIGQQQSKSYRASTLKAGAIIDSPTRKLAFLNGHYYTVGEKINGDTITQIDRNQIILETSNNTVVVKVPASQPVKRIHEEKK